MEKLRSKIYLVSIVVLLVLNAVVAYQLYRIYVQEQQAPQSFEERELYFYLEEVKKDPRNLEARINLVIALAELGRVEEAEEELKKAQKLNSKDPRIFSAAALIEVKKGNKDRAAEFYKRAIEADPTDNASRLELARILIEKKKFEEAISILEEAKKIAPMIADTYYLLGKCYKETGETSAAKENLMKALQLAPDFKEAREELSGLGN